jgi:hypothetical protein
MDLTLVDEAKRKVRPPKRDWILLPLISLLTVCLLAGSTELLARWLFPEMATEGEDCMIFTDPVSGARGIPNSVCWEKIPEGELTEYQFNRCGHRAGMECGPKPPGTFRIVMIGTSFAIGMRVPREQTFAALLPVELSRRTGLKVQLYNEAIPFKLPDTIAAHFDEALEAKPDMILWALNSSDIHTQSQVAVLPAPASVRNLSLLMRLRSHLKTIFAAKSFAASVTAAFSSTRSATMLSHFLYESRSQYVKSTLMEDDDKVGYLKTEQSEGWQKRLSEFDRDAARIEAQAKAAGVPLVVVLLPNRAQAAMISMGQWPPGIDPYKLDEQMRSIITSHGGTYIDMLTDVRTIPDPQLGYFPVEGHPNGRGHGMFTALLASELTSGAVPALKATSPSQTASKQSE